MSLLLGPLHDPSPRALFGRSTPRPASTTPEPPTLPRVDLLPDLPVELDPLADVATVEAFLPVAVLATLPDYPAGLALDVWRARIRRWCAEHDVPVVAVRRAGHWPEDPPPFARPWPWSAHYWATMRYHARHRARVEGRPAPAWADQRRWPRPPAATEEERRARSNEQARDSMRRRRTRERAARLDAG